jgi:hypothetical protein
MVVGVYCIGSVLGFVARLSSSVANDMLSPKRAAHRWAVRAIAFSFHPLMAAIPRISLQSISPARPDQSRAFDASSSSAVLSDLLRFRIRWAFSDVSSGSSYSDADSLS